MARDGRIARYGTGWFDPPAGLRGPIKQHPDYPLRGNETGRPTPALGNYKDPILKPWAAEKMRVSNEELLSGKIGIPFLPQSRCWPGGTPGQLLWTTEPVYIIQTPKIVYMVWQRDQWVRRIFLTDRHSQEVKPSWYGELIGRYENGELVVDTIGLSAHPLGVLDMFRTPHTEKLHVVERFKVTADNKFLEALVRFEDEDTFNEPWYATKRWKKGPVRLAGNDLRREQWRLFQRQPGADPARDPAGFLRASKAPSPRARCEPISTHSRESANPVCA